MRVTIGQQRSLIVQYIIFHSYKRKSSEFCNEEIKDRSAWSCRFKAKAFLREAESCFFKLNMEGYEGWKKDNGSKKCEVWIYWSTCSLTLATFRISQHFSLSLYHLLLCQLVHAHSIIRCRTPRLIYECSIGGLGHEQLLDIHHTHHSYIHSSVTAMKGRFETGCWADNTQLN